MDRESLEKLLSQIKPISKEKLNEQIGQLNPKELSLLSPLISKLNKDKSDMSGDELIKLGNEILKDIKDANKNHDSK